MTTKNIEKIKEEAEKNYKERLPIYEALQEEVIFILRENIQQKKLKIHGIESRIKTIDSIVQKAEQQNIDNPINQLKDIVGARVICLFRSQIEKIAVLIKEAFEIIEYKDIINEGEVSSFGYMSVHFTAKMKKNYSGPRYEKIKDTIFEIQLRTISMHSWAIISHHLDYKGDWDVPKSLKKSLNALSALFYIADNEFEAFYNERAAFEKNLKKSGDALSERSINYDTLKAYIEKKFPDRDHKIVDSDDVSTLSSLVKELQEKEILTIKALDEKINNKLPAFKKWEKDGEDYGENFFHGIGVIRMIFDKNDFL